MKVGASLVSVAMPVGIVSGRRLWQHCRCASAAIVRELLNRRPTQSTDTLVAAKMHTATGKSWRRANAARRAGEVAATSKPATDAVRACPCWHTKAYENGTYYTE